MGILQQYFHAIGAFNALLLSLILLVTRHLNPAGKVLSVWLIAWAIYAVSPLLLINANTASLNLLHVLALWIPASFGALLYLYLTFSIRQRTFSRRDILTFLPFFICLLLNLEYALMSDIEFAKFRDTGVDFDVQHFIAIVFLYGQAVFFFGKSYFLISVYKKQTEKQLSNYEPDIFKGLLLIISTNFILWLLEIMSAILGGVYFLTLASDILFTLYLCALGLMHWHRPNFFCIEAVNSQESASSTASISGSILDPNLRD